MSYSHPLFDLVELGTYVIERLQSLTGKVTQLQSIQTTTDDHFNITALASAKVAIPPPPKRCQKRSYTIIPKLIKISRPERLPYYLSYLCHRAKGSSNSMATFPAY
eukprot:sb/3477776/